MAWRGSWTDGKRPAQLPAPEAPSRVVRFNRFELERFAALFGVSYGWAQKVAAARRRKGRAERPAGAKRRFPSRLTAELRLALSAQIRTRPDATLAGLQQWLSEEHGVGVSVSRPCTVLQELVAQDEPFHAAEQDTPTGLARREQWWREIAEIGSESLMFLDESGVMTDLTRRYGRAPRGQRVPERTPGGHWPSVTLLGAVGVAGWKAAMSIAGAADGIQRRSMLGHLPNILIRSEISQLSARK